MMKILNKYDPVTTFSIWTARWHDKRVLLNAYKVDGSKTDNLKIVFTKEPTLEGEFYVSRKRVREFKKESNGTIPVYSVPLTELDQLRINERDLREVW